MAALAPAPAAASGAGSRGAVRRGGVRRGGVRRGGQPHTQSQGVSETGGQRRTQAMPGGLHGSDSEDGLGPALSELRPGRSLGPVFPSEKWGQQSVPAFPEQEVLGLWTLRKCAELRPGPWAPREGGLGRGGERAAPHPIPPLQPSSAHTRGSYSMWSLSCGGPGTSGLPGPPGPGPGPALWMTQTPISMVTAEGPAPGHRLASSPSLEPGTRRGPGRTQPRLSGHAGRWETQALECLSKGCVLGEKQSNKGVWCDSAGASVTASVTGASTHDIVKVPVGGDPRSHWGFPDVRLLRLLFSHSEPATPR